MGASQSRWKHGRCRTCRSYGAGPLAATRWPSVRQSWSGTVPASGRLDVALEANETIVRGATEVRAGSGAVSLIALGRPDPGCTKCIGEPCQAVGQEKD